MSDFTLLVCAKELGLLYLTSTSKRWALSEPVINWGLCPQSPHNKLGACKNFMNKDGQALCLAVPKSIALGTPAGFEEVVSSSSLNSFHLAHYQTSVSSQFIQAFSSVWKQGLGEVKNWNRPNSHCFVNPEPQKIKVHSNGSLLLSFPDKHNQYLQVGGCILSYPFPMFQIPSLFPEL